MLDLDYCLRSSLEQVEGKAAAARSPAVRKAYLDLAEHYRARLKFAPVMLKN
jgi:hypothetical protein